MKRTINIITTVEVEMTDDVLDKILPSFNQYMFETDAEQLLAHIATQTAKDDEWIEGIGENGNTFKATVTNVDTEII